MKIITNKKQLPVGAIPITIGTHFMPHCLLFVAYCLLAISSAYALPLTHSTTATHKQAAPPPSLLSGCTPGLAMTDLDINNVRARMCTGGDMWWDYAKAMGQYEIPKGSGLMPMYAGALWIGGMNSGNLYLAGQEYRSGGNNDWWPGPLTTEGAATISPEVCQQYDQHYKITQSEVAAFVGGSGPATSAITNWPGNGNTALGQTQYLAPFFDKNGDGLYKSADGDYPGFDLFSNDDFGGCQANSCTPVDQLFGDQSIWWVINDKGNIHSNTKGLPMGIEVHCQAFGFFTDDEINSMTFINYRIYNRSSLTLDSTFIGLWADPDLGCATDDYVGCDVSRGLGYVYNGTNNDVTCAAEKGYGVNPPALGIDFFRGPIATPGDGKDNNHDCQIDEPCEQAIMTHFVYYTNHPAPYGDPTIAKEYYNYMSGTWDNGTPFYYGGLGYPSGGSTTIQTAYCFPGLSDQQYQWGVGGNCGNPGTSMPDWTEVTAGAKPDDRRFVQSAGPFRLLPGAVNVVTAGVVYARASSGGPQASVNLMLLADDKAQKLFDNCFQVLNGPDAPDLTIQELDKKLILYLSNKPTSNNYNENYKEYDASISLADSTGQPISCIDTTYHFEGYKIYQLKDGTVSAGDLENADKARLVAQCDVKNGVTSLVNYLADQTLGALVPTQQVSGSDKGLFHSLVVTTDLFAKGDPMLVNHKTYYYMALAYGYNNFKPYKQDGVVNWADNQCTHPADWSATPAMDGQKKPYKQGRKNIFSYSAIPHVSTPYTGGTEIHGAYGNGPMITRVEGNGNGGRALDFTSETTEEILESASGRILHPTYASGKGPVNVKVIDPLNVPENNFFTFKFDTVSVIPYKTSTLVGAFQIGETVTGVKSGATGVIINNYPVTIPPPASAATASSIVHLKSIKGTFYKGESIQGAKSGATATSIAKTVDNAAWMLINNTTGDTVRSDKTIQAANEQLILQWGLSLNIQQTTDPGSGIAPNGFLEATMTFSGGKWLTGVADKEATSIANWIHSGTYTVTPNPDYLGLDDDQVYEGVLGGTWAPYALTACSSSPFKPATDYYTGPGFSPLQMSLTNMKDLASVDVVLTSDKSKWTRCVVLEMCEDTIAGQQAYSYSEHLNGSFSRRFDKRSHYSVDKNGNTNPGGPISLTNPNDPNYISDKGMGWFPGYAVNLETGERLNICFGENSALSLRKGAVIQYNRRGSIVYGGALGTFQAGETVNFYSGSSSKVVAFAKIVSDDSGSGYMVVSSILGLITPPYAMVGTSSGAKATVQSFDYNKFTVNETINGASGATGKILVDDGTGSMNISVISGTFVSGELITESNTSSSATCNSVTPYSQNDNGADMKWNPTANTYGPAPWSANLNAPVFGGQHYIYVFGHNKDYTNSDKINVPCYDAGKRIDSVLSFNSGHPTVQSQREIFRDAMWVNIPLLATDHSLLESDVTIRLRVAKTYKKGYTTSTDLATSPQNYNMPMYTFGTEGIATHTMQNDFAVSALDLINVVPNPYYAYSSYETNNLDSRIKITNLPEQCTVSIYNLGGTLIKRIKKGEAIVNLSPKGSGSPAEWSDGSLDWDLKNTAGTPIASGVYIIHVEVPGVGEKIVKWFGVMRPIDLGSF